MDRVVPRVRALWAEVGGAELPAGGVRVVCSRGSGICPPGWVGSVSVGGSVLITAPTPELADRLTATLAAPGLPPVPAADLVLGRLAAGGTLGPARLAYLDPGDFGGAAGEERVPPDRLAGLFAAAAEDEVGESGLDGIAAAAVAVVREQGRIVAAAGWHPWPAGTAHLGVLTAADARGRGLATRVAAAASADALAAGRLPQWRARVPASERVAAKLGYRVLGRQFSVRPATT